MDYRSFNSRANQTAYAERKKDVSIKSKKRAGTKKSESLDRASAIEDSFLAAMNKPYEVPQHYQQGPQTRGIRTWRKND